MATRGSIPKLMEAAGIDMLPPAVGVPFIRRELAARRGGEVVVAGRLGRMTEEFDPTGGLDTAIEVKPTGVMVGRVTGMGIYSGLTVESTLDPAAQPFLDHHRIDGTPVLPGVMGIEAFAEAATLLFPALRVAAVEDVEFLPGAPCFRDRDLLERLIAETHGSEPAVHDLAREVRYRLYDRPVLMAVRERAYAAAEAGLARLAAAPGQLPAGEFVEHELDATGSRLAPVARPYGQNRANVVVGVIRNFTGRYPEGMARVIVLGDPSRGMGALAEPECRRILAALDLAREMGVPLEWFALSAGARIAMDSGTENMDWIGRVLRRLVELTQAGQEVNVVVMGINVGAQPYWNAEATMLMHTRGIVIMTPEGAMVLTGKQALDYSGGVSAEDNLGIGGVQRAQRVGSVHHIIPPERLRPYLIDTVERGMAREMKGIAPPPLALAGVS